MSPSEIETIPRTVEKTRQWVSATSASRLPMLLRGLLLEGWAHPNE